MSTCKVLDLIVIGTWEVPGHISKDVKMLELCIHKYTQPWFQRLNRLSSLSSAVSQTDETVSPLWWIVRIWSNLSPISWFAECPVSYFRSFVNIFQTQLPPIPIPISLQLKSEFTWNYLACLSLFILILLVSTPHFSCFFFYIKKISVAQGWASLEQRGSNPEAPEAARAQRSAGHRGGLGHRGRSMSGRATLQEIGVWVQTKRHVFWRIERTTEWTRERLWVSKTCLLLSSHCLRSLLQVLGRWQVYLRYNIYFKIF